MLDTKREGCCQGYQGEGQQQNADGVQRMSIGAGKFAFRDPDLRCRERQHTDGNVDQEDVSPPQTEDIGGDQDAAHDLCGRGGKA